MKINISIQLDDDFGFLEDFEYLIKERIKSEILRIVINHKETHKYIENKVKKITT